MARSANSKAKKTSGTTASARTPKKPKNPATPALEKAHWSRENVKVLVKFLVEKKAAAGDGGNFKKVTFKEAADYLATLPYEGLKKNGDSCKNKWSRLKKEFWAVQELKRASGFSYSDEDGAGITEAMERVWDAFIKQHPDAKPFKNTGLPYYDEMVKLMPVKAKGSNVFRPGHGKDDLGGANQDEDEDEDEEVDQLDGSEDIEKSDGDADKDEDLDEDEDSEEDMDADKGLSGGVDQTPRRTSPQKNLATPVASQKRRSPAIPDSHVKKPRMSQGAIALQGVEGQLDAMNSLLHNFLVAESASTTSQVTPPMPLTPQRKQLAIRRAQQLEGHLDDDQLVSLFNIFEKDAGAADAYLAIDMEWEGLRKTWIDRKLGPF